MSPLSYSSVDSSNPANIGHRDEKDVTILDRDSDINPGELTFEEGHIGAIIGTGIFATPSSILGSVGSVGASMMLWVLGFALSLCGLFVWLELGAMFPRSGGTKVYLEAVYRRPKHLASVVFAICAITLNFSSGNCICPRICGTHPDLWAMRGIAMGVIFFTVFLHGFAPRLGVYVMNVSRTFIPHTICSRAICLIYPSLGWVVLSGKTRVKDPHVNFRHAFAGSSHSGNDYATAMFKVLFTFYGWQNANYVLNDVKDPVRTLKIAGPLGLAITAILYIFANIAYFAASPKTAILESGTTVASLFFENVFGTQAQKALTVFVALRCNVLSIAYSAARINQELAKEGVPLPFGNRLWATNWPTQNAPFPGLVVHLITTVIFILAPPLRVAFPFILDVSGYPGQIINLFVILGLFYLRWKKPHLLRPFKVWLPFAFFFLAAEVFLIIAPFLRPANGVGDAPPLAYYLYCFVGIGVMAFGVLYWAVWKLVLPYVFKFRLVPRKEVLEDGTVVTLFSREKAE
ncbi:amino acid transporter [Russula brevipes]|nr:amino acid transporter [Russula brevipes]